MRHIKAPHRYTKEPTEVTIFLAGAIDNGQAINWQEYVAEQLKEIDNLIILNPRRDDWDSTWDCSKNNPQFAEQVNWELDGINNCDLVLVYFPANSIAPISLLELGLLASSPYDNKIVVCENGYHRKGNVDIVCERYGVVQLDTLDNAINHYKQFDLSKFAIPNGLFLEE